MLCWNINNISAMRALEKGFKERKEWFNNRSSTFFPVLLNNKIDTFIVFQNYWKWKSNNNSCSLNIRFYECSGTLLKTYTQKIEYIHNEINLSKIIRNDCDRVSDYYHLSAEVEIISTNNLGFPFPAIMLFFVSNESGEVSCVHSAGRSLNSNEKHIKVEFQETNWLAIEDENFTPFFHIFNPGYQDNDNKGVVSIVIDSCPELGFEFDIELPSQPYSSKIFYLKQFLTIEQSALLKEKNFYLIVSFSSHGFMRLIVGNLHKKSQFHYITHSFGKIDSNASDISYADADQVSSFLPMLNKKPLKLITKSYPTNISLDLSIERTDYLKNSNSGLAKGSLQINSASKDFKINIFELSESMMSLYSIKGSSPSRLNSSYNYSLINSTHPTDIATGFKSYHYPHKSSHWGHGLLIDGFKTTIFFRDVSHNNLDQRCNCKKIELQLSSENITFNRFIDINTWNYIELTREDFPDCDSKFFSWRFMDDSSGCIETFWISYCLSSGAICGDHGF